MKKNILTLIVFLIFVPRLSAQVKNDGLFSLDEIKEMVASSAEEKCSSVFDSFADSEGVFILESPTLRVVEGESLPASRWLFCSSKDGKGYAKRRVGSFDEGDDVLLCWAGCRDSAANVAWKKSLAKRYGTIPLGDGEEVVPAVWVSDTLYRASYASWHNGLWPVKTSYPAWLVKKGKVASVCDEDDHALTSSCPHTSLTTWVMDLRLDLFSVLDGDGRRQREAAKAEMMLLGYEVNQPSPSETVWPDGLSFLVWVKPGVDGHLDCDVVEPASLTAEQQAYADELCAAVRKVDNLCVPVRRTLHGKVLRGMLLRVKKDTPCWTFDYDKE